MGKEERGISPKNPGVLERAAKWAVRSPVGRVVTAAAVLGVSGVDINCGKPAAEVRPTITSTPTEEQYLTGLKGQGIPTLVPVGGQELSEEIIAIGEKIKNRQPLTPEEGALANQFNLEHPQKGEAPTPAEAQKPKVLPKVINNETTNFVQLPPGEIQALIDEVQPKGERKLPMPDIVKNNPKISIKEITDNSGRYKSLALVSSETGTRTYGLPALRAGTVIELNVSKLGQLSTFRSVGIKTEDGNIYGYLVPDNASSNFKIGDYVTAGQIIITFIYAPNSPQVDSWISGLQSQTKEAPAETIATIGGGSKGLSENDILTLQNSVVVIGPQGKG